jgi:hypothetical protein
VPTLEEPEKIERSPLPPGEYTVTLTEIKPHESPNTFQPAVLNEETGQMEQPIRREWIWRFVTEVMDPKANRPYEYAVWTPRYFNPNSEKNKLTLLVRLLAPDASPDELKGMIETDYFIGKKWKVRINTMTSEKTGKTYPKHLYFIPISADPTEVPV